MDVGVGILDDVLKCTPYSDSSLRPCQNHYLKPYSKGVKTSHDRQIFIFSSQFFRAIPSQMVPLINQQSLPAWNSQAGQRFFSSEGHLFITQHVFLFLLPPLRLATKKKAAAPHGPALIAIPARNYVQPSEKCPKVRPVVFASFPASCVCLKTLHYARLPPGTPVLLDTNDGQNTTLWYFLST